MKPIIAVPATLLLVYRAWSRNSLTPAGIVVAALTAISHAVHPSPAPFALLVVFFLGGTAVTKVKHNVKAKLTVSSMGSPGGEGPRTHVQVLANSLVASILTLLHARQLYQKRAQHPPCFAYGDDLLMVGIVANYAAVAADTYSSELGILSKSDPRLIISPTLRKVPRGTNGGVTLVGLGAGVLGALTMALTSLMLPFCPLGSLSGFTTTGLDGGRAWGGREKIIWVLAVTAWGALGSVLDSILGGLLQATVVDKRTGKVVEGEGGNKVLVHPGEVVSTGPAEVSVRKNTQLRAMEDVANVITPRSVRHETDSVKDETTGSTGDKEGTRKLEIGHDIFDNNTINLLMAATMSMGGMAVASYAWNVPLSSVLV